MQTLKPWMTGSNDVSYKQNALGVVKSSKKIQTILLYSNFFPDAFWFITMVALVKCLDKACKRLVLPLVPKQRAIE